MCHIIYSMYLYVYQNWAWSPYIKRNKASTVCLCTYMCVCVSKNAERHWVWGWRYVKGCMTHAVLLLKYSMEYKMLFVRQSARLVTKLITLCKQVPKLPNQNDTFQFLSKNVLQNSCLFMSMPRCLTPFISPCIIYPNELLSPTWVICLSLPIK